MLDEARNRLYVLTRFDNAVVGRSTSATRREIAHVVAAQPRARARRRRAGRSSTTRTLTSANGEASCSSCHIFGDMDELGWDLGNPDDVVTTNPIPINLAIVGITAPLCGRPINGTGDVERVPPHEGADDDADAARAREQRRHALARRPRRPASSARHGPAVRRRRSRSTTSSSRSPGCSAATSELAAADMQKFTDFALADHAAAEPGARARQLAHAVAAGAGATSTSARACSDGIAGPLGRQLGFTCDGCHTPRAAANGFFGTDGRASFENETQIVKIPHLRNLYQKVGMFGMPDVAFFHAGDNGHKGDQIRGFGFLHDGSVDTLFRFFHATVFNATTTWSASRRLPDDAAAPRHGAVHARVRPDLAPIVGQQVTMTNTSRNDTQRERAREPARVALPRVLRVV